MLANRPKSSRLLAGRARATVMETSTTTSLSSDSSTPGSSGRQRSKRDQKLPSLAKINQEIMDASVELVKRGAMEPAELVSWIADKKGVIILWDGMIFGQE